MKESKTRTRTFFLLGFLIVLFLGAGEIAFADRNDDEGEGEGFPVPILFGVSLDALTPNFGNPRGGGSREHEGLDMLAPEGTPVVSPTEAEVARVGDYPGAGKYVITENDGGERFYYYHLEDQAEDLDRGDELEAGELIGFVGSTGNASEAVPHLHFEIREDGDPKDPYERITEEFELDEKIDFLEEILGDVDNEEELAEFLTKKYPGVFIQARAKDIELPEEILDELPDDFEDGGGAPTRDLSVGSEGGAVSLLQSILIAGGYLDITTPTGYFGPLTKAALVEYQEENDIEPASGYYGPITQAHMSNAPGGEGDEREESDDEDQNEDNEELRKKLIAKIATLTKLVAELVERVADLKEGT